MREKLLTVSIHDYWHCGSGRGEGSRLDAQVDRDANGLPYVPGRTLKGLFREALRTLEALNALPENTANRLLGHAASDKQTRHDSNPGLLAISDARLPAELSNWLAGREGQKHLPSLFNVHYSTAIDPLTGAAQDKSLRGMEVAIPLDLECTVSGPEEVAWVESLAATFPLIRAVGGHRQRGYGRCTLAWRNKP